MPDTNDDQDQQKKRAFQPPVQQSRPLPAQFSDVAGGVSGLHQSAPGASPTAAMPMSAIGQQMARPLPTQPVPESPAGIAARNEYSRLTVPQRGIVPSGHDIIGMHGEERPIMVQGKDESLPGWRQIHNPFLRTLAGIGDVASSFFPAQSMLIPGTTLHHNMLAHQARTALDEQEKARAQEAAIRGEATKEDLEKQQTQAGKITNDFELWRAQHPDEPVETWLKTLQQFKPQTEHNETPFDLWRRQNPDKPAEEWLKIEGQAKGEHAPNEYADFKAAYSKEHPQATSEEIVRAFSAAKQAPAKEPQNEYEDFKKGYMQAHPNATPMDVARSYSVTRQTPPQTIMITPSDQAINVRPGTKVPEGSRSASGFTHETEVSAAEQHAKEQAKAGYQTAAKLAANPSPTNDLALLMQYIGATKPESLGKLRLNNNEINLVLGTRGTFGDLEALVQKVRNGQKLIPQQRQDMLKTMRILAGIEEGGAPAGGGAAAPGAKIEDLRKKYNY